MEILRHVMRDPDPGRRGELMLTKLFAPLLPRILRRLAALGEAYDVVSVNDLLVQAAIPNSLFSPDRLVVTITSQPVGGFANIARESACLKLVGSPPIMLSPDHNLGCDFKITDFWILEPPLDFVVEPEVDAFLNNSAPVIAFTFGSAWKRDPYFSEDALVQAAQMAQDRAVIQDIKRCDCCLGARADNPRVLFVGELPYSWLFKRVSCVVHHGGAGTISEAVRAGRPSVILPQYGDQLYWARRLETCGASAGTLLPEDVTPEALSALIRRAIDDGRYRRAAEHVGRQLRPAEGIALACDHIEALCRR
jgi:hypothetical protein